MSHEKRRSLRARLIALVLVPSTTLFILWALLATTFTGDIYGLRAGITFMEEVGEPTTEVIAHLQRERRATVAALDSPTARAAEDLQTTRAHTDEAVDTLVQALHAQNRDALPHQALEFQRRLNELPDQRQRIDALTDEADVLDEAATPYTTLVETGIRLWDSQVEHTDAALSTHLRSLTSLMRTRELLHQQDTVLAHATATGTFTPQAHTAFAAAVGAQRHTWSRVDAETAPSPTGDLALLEDSPQFETVELLQDTIIGAPSGASGQGVPVNAQFWRGAAEALDARILEVEDQQRHDVFELGHAQDSELRLRALLTTVPALVVALASAAVGVIGAQRMGRRLQGLRTQTLRHARFRLPEVTARLRAGQDVDVDTEAPRLKVARNDELGQVTQAFNEAQRAAVAAAVEEARVRAGVRNMFRNIARRTQSLVHRQLALLDRLERDETDPKVLESLFRIDHFSTQMRRNAENLMLLSGDRPVRRGGVPVGLHEAVRAAASEIEDYARVRVQSLPRVSLRGEVGADLVRLLAELLENATMFSPPDTQVRVEGELHRGRYRIRVRDEGLGMTPGQLESSNTLLADPPRFDLGRIREDSQLGLYVVATIAARHGFEVSLRAAPYQGTEATVDVPVDLVADSSSTGPMRAPGSRPPLLRAPVPASTSTSTPAPPPDNSSSEQDGVLPQRRRAPTAPSFPVPDPVASAAIFETEPREEGGPRPSPAEEGQTHMGLPRRRRRVPESPSAPPSVPAGGAAADTGDQRSLSQIRTMMSAFQAGTERGRAEAVQDSNTDRACDERVRDQHDQDREG